MPIQGKAEYQKKYRANNPEKTKDYCKKYYWANIEKAKIRRKKQYLKNSFKEKAKARKWRKENPDKARMIDRRSILKKYGITPEKYDSILITQNKQCGICKKPASKFKRNLSVDHNHETGKIRGLLCNKCNRGIGNFNDDVEIMNRGAEYLRRGK